jgi:hypothetical protein
VPLPPLFSQFLKVFSISILPLHYGCHQVSKRHIVVLLNVWTDWVHCTPLYFRRPEMREKAMVVITKARWSTAQDLYQYRVSQNVLPLHFLDSRLARKNVSRQSPQNSTDKAKRWQFSVFSVNWGTRQ